MQVSILIPTFNQQKYLKRCVESIQKNTDTRYEIIFINNGVTKGGSKWLQSILNVTLNCRLIDAQFTSHAVTIEDFCLRSRLAGFKNA